MRGAAPAIASCRLATVVSMPAAAMQFPLAHPAVCAVIPGPRTAAEFNENLPLFSQKIPAAFWAEMKAQGLIHAAAPVPA